uniref:Uncharacterized protein n=1 Tax=Anguilla anguilla TaxID=7936 RepID=A0A0E9R7J0_ANGAN
MRTNGVCATVRQTRFCFPSHFLKHTGLNRNPICPVKHIFNHIRAGAPPPGNHCP